MLVLCRTFSLVLLIFPLLGSDGEFHNNPKQHSLHDQAVQTNPSSYNTLNPSTDISEVLRVLQQIRRKEELKRGDNPNYKVWRD